MSDLLVKKLRELAEEKAEDRRAAEFGPGGGNPEAKAEDHIEWIAADRISELQAKLARNNMLSERVEKLKEEIVCLTTDTPLNERLLTQRRTIESLQAKLARVEWQPIETAPRDGRHIIGWFGNSAHGAYAEQVYFDHGIWVWSQDGDIPSTNPTHWMPLPEPPQALEQDD